ncbi:vitamin K epoxide reductase family protein [Bacteroides sp.]|uniref:vitamin K epoxide reductase family protein n=1 Tax=Bacteroides sp. TaxID=29523 RepID=UPI0025B91D4C|nr:vitamin K epoxide reductase family protein [Bacteroides sp.]
MRVELARKDNILTGFLYYLGVKYTNEYANRLYNEHPNKYSLLGLSKMLSDYNIKNYGVRIDDKIGAIHELEVPFIAHIGFDFVVVYKITVERVYYVWNKKGDSTLIDEFLKIWSGIILYAEPDEKSIEPDYEVHYRKELIVFMQKVILLTAIPLIFVVSFFKNELYKEFEYYLLTAVNLGGVYIGYLLVLKQIHIYSEYADKICSLFSNNDCNNILESDAAKLVGVIGWSEIGLGYFLTNALIVVCFPGLLSYMTLVNIVALPYTLWSIWYQKFKAKQWCPLCLIVQSLLWAIFFINIGFGLISIAEINLVDILITGLLYLVFMLLINILVPNWGQKRKMEQIVQNFNSIKMDENVFATMLKKQPYYEVDKNISSILWGNKDSEMLVTILTNPHCNPCARMHKQVEDVLSATNNLCIQYIFSSFSRDLDSSGKFLLAIYFGKDEIEKRNIFKQWFERDKNNKEEFFKTYNMDIENEMITDEYSRHQAWKNKTGLRVTPTILINGYKLPDNYKIEDLKNIMNLDV